MTAREFNRARRWDKKVYKAYQEGVIDGFDACLAGHDKAEPLLSEYNLKFYFRPRMRRAQMVTNAVIARSRGRADGWDSAHREVVRAQDDDWIERQVLDGLLKFEQLLRAA